MKRRAFSAKSMFLPFAATALATTSGDVMSQTSSATDSAQKKALAAMKRAAEYMDQTVSYNGGYVWAYSPDLTST